MLAYVWSEDGFNLENVENPHPLEGEVGVWVEACGLCQTDLHVMSGTIPFPSPCVLGHEVAGVVDEVGPGVTGFAVGDRVAAGFIMPCGRCRQCVRGQDDQCKAFLELNRVHGVLYDGTSRLRSQRGELATYSMGGLAERCVLPAGALVHLSGKVNFDEGAVLGCSGLTALGAVQNVAQVWPGESVAVIGVGGVGLNVVQLARLHSADPLIAVDLDPNRLTLARTFGATHTVNASTEDVVGRLRELTDGGVDVCFDVVGNTGTVDTAAHAVDSGGRVVVVGVAAAGAPVQLDVLDLVRRKVQVLGSFGGRTRQDLPRLVRYTAERAIDVRGLITNRYSFADADQAVADFRAGKVNGRAVITFGNGTTHDPGRPEQTNGPETTRRPTLTDSH